jgi:hypothetical protein
VFILCPHLKWGAAVRPAESDHSLADRFENVAAVRQVIEKLPTEALEPHRLFRGGAAFVVEALVGEDFLRHSKAGALARIRQARVLRPLIASIADSK